MKQPPRLRCPDHLIEGPAKVYFMMENGTYYSAIELEEKTGFAKSTLARHLKLLTDEGLLVLYRGNNPRGRPSHFYRLATINDKESTPA